MKVKRETAKGGAEGASYFVKTLRPKDFNLTNLWEYNNRNNKDVIFLSFNHTQRQRSCTSMSLFYYLGIFVIHTCL